MRRKFLLSITLVLGLCSLASADEWKKTYQLSGPPTLEVSTTDASVIVDTWEQKAIEADVFTDNWKIGDHGIGITESQSGNTVRIEVHFPHASISFGGGHRHVEIRVHMPAEGKVDIQTHDGSIRLAGLKGDIQLRSGDGSQDIDSVDGSLRASAGDGRIRAKGRFDRLDLRTGDGSIEAEVLSGSHITSEWSVQTGDGQMRLTLPPDFAADVEAKTSDGHISFDMPLTVSGDLTNHHIRGKLNGGGGGLLTLGSSDGSIHVAQGAASL